MNKVELRQWLDDAPTEHVTLPKALVLSLIEDHEIDLFKWEDSCDDALVGAFHRGGDEPYDVDSAEFSLDYNSRIRLESVDLNWGIVIRTILDHLQSKLNE